MTEIVYNLLRTLVTYQSVTYFLYVYMLTASQLYKRKRVWGIESDICLQPIVANTDVDTLGNIRVIKTQKIIEKWGAKKYNSQASVIQKDEINKLAKQTDVPVLIHL